MHNNKLVRCLRQPTPIVDKSLHTNAGKSPGILLNVANRFPLALVYIGPFSDRPIAVCLSQILAGMKIVHPCAIGPRPVAKAQLGAEVGAQKESPKDLVVTNQPGRNRGSKDERRN